MRKHSKKICQTSFVLPLNYDLLLVLKIAPHTQQAVDCRHVYKCVCVSELGQQPAQNISETEGRMTKQEIFSFSWPKYLRKVSEWDGNMMEVPWSIVLAAAAAAITAMDNKYTHTQKSCQLH